MTEYNNNTPRTLSECFSFDNSLLNPTPKTLFKKFYKMRFDFRYSATVFLRLSQYFFLKGKNKNRISRMLYEDLSKYFRRKNEINNGICCSRNPLIAPGIIFHHKNVIITSKAIVEQGVHFYGNVTLGIRNGGSPVIKRNVKIAGNAMVLGAVVIGEGAIIAPGAIVFNDVPNGKIAGGIPAKIIGTVNKDNYDF